MLARGAACDTCRARKVKCDASRPFCTPCLKSARGNPTVAQDKCRYEGTSVAAAREAAAAAREAAGANGAKRKRKSAAASGGGGGGGGGSQDGLAGEAKRSRVSSAGSGTSAAMHGVTQGEYAGVPAWAHQPPTAQAHLPTAPAPYAAPPHPHQHLQQQHQQQAYSPSVLTNLAASHPSAPPLGYPPPPTSTQPLEYRPPAIPAPPSSYVEPSSASTTASASIAHDGAPVTGPPPPLAPASSPAPDTVPRERVVDLEDRIAELERALRAAAAAPPPLPPAHQQQPQQQASTSWYNGPSAPLAHTRSPSFPYASYLPPPSSSGGVAASYLGGGGASPYSTSFPPPLSSTGVGGLGGAGAGYGMGGGGSPSIGGIGASSFLSSENRTGAASPLGFLAPIGGGGGVGGSPRSMAGLGRSDPSRRSLSALSAAAVTAGLRDDAPFGGGVSSWAAASPLSSLRGTGGGGDVLLGASPRAMVSSLRGTAPMQQQQGHGLAQSQGQGQTPGSSTGEGGASAGAGSGGSSTSGTTPAGGPSPSSVVDKANMSASSLTMDAAAAAGHAAADDGAFELDEFALTPELYALLHPAYPPSLPPIATLHHLVSTFFLRASVPATMLSRAGILTSLAYGPADPRWPDEALLHAMCAYGALYVSTASLSEGFGGGGGAGGGGAGGVGGGALGLELGGEGYVKGRRSAYWEREADKSPREYHYRLAKDSIQSSLQSGKGRRKMLQVVQATVLTCYVAYQSAQFTDLWIFAGLATRLCTPLGLNHLDPWDFANGRCGPEKEDWGVRVRFVERQDLLETPRTVEEHWERATTWWMAFAVDRFASASTDWSTSIDEQDITTHLPCISPYPHPSLEIDLATGLIPSLSIMSHSFLEDTSAPTGSLGLYVKACVLLGRVVNYLQRLPRTKCVKRGAACSAVKAHNKSLPGFIELDVALSRFKESVGPRLYDAVGDGIDGFLVSAYCIPHAATILLHESFTDRYVREPTSSLSRCQTAATCIVNAMHVLYGSSHDLAGGDPFQPVCWSIAGRALVRDFATRRLWGDLDEAEVSKGLAEDCLQFHEVCQKGGSGIAGALAQTLQRHLDNPDMLLPMDGPYPRGS
ncbi:hypothetical protein JCM3775_005700 [Rhodotorula graminis]